MRAYLDAGHDGLGARRKIRLKGEDDDFGEWRGSINVALDMRLEEIASSRVVFGKKRYGFLSVFRTGEWDFNFAGERLCSANVKVNGVRGVFILDDFVPLTVDEYWVMSRISGKKWKLEKATDNQGDVTIEADSEKLLLAVACASFLYEVIIAQSH
jgi:hypothetical protein